MIQSVLVQVLKIYRFVDGRIQHKQENRGNGLHERLGWWLMMFNVMTDDCVARFI
jgi:hypothetical protein